MNIRHKVSLITVALGVVVSVVGCSVSIEGNVTSRNIKEVNSELQEKSAPITAPADAKVDFTKPKVVAVSPDVSLPPVSVPDTIVTTPPDVPAVPTAPESSAIPSDSLRVISAPIRLDAKVKPPLTPAPVDRSKIPAPTLSVTPSREINVSLRGGLDVLDQYSGPVLYDFPAEAGLPPYVAEHDLVGGWERFGSLEKGMTVKMTGLVTGTYRVGEIINVPQGGEVSELLAFSTRPKVMLQTCVPWTDRMIVVGLY